MNATTHLPRVSLALIAVVVWLGGCGADDGGGSNTGGSDAADAGGQSDSGSGDGSTSGDTGAPNVDSPTPEEADRILLTEGIDGSRNLRDLTEPELEIVCVAQENYMLDLSFDHRRYHCVADAIDASLLAPDPAFTCDRLRGGCDQLLDIEEQFADLFGDSDSEEPPPTASCMFDMQARNFPVCNPPTLAEYKACVLENLARETAVLDRRSMTCTEAAEVGTLRPEGIEECACGMTARLGYPPADDEDWDFVPDSLDVCPNTDRFYAATEWGCDEYSDRDADRVWDEIDECPLTDPAAEGINEVGCSLAQDLDQDGVPDLYDRCLGTAPGAELVGEGCSIQQDEDADGVPNAWDWCPFTEVGDEEISYSGCTPSQGEPWLEPYVAELPEGLTEFALGDDDDQLIRFHVVPTGIGQKEDGTETTFAGTMLMDAGPAGYLQLPGSSVTFGPLDPTTGRPSAMTGRIPFPLPSFGLFDLFRVNVVGGCDVTFAMGAAAEIQALGLPVLDEDPYLAVECDGEFRANLAGISFTISDSASASMVLSPLDPAIYLIADIGGLGLIRHVERVAVGLSAQGRIPFVPATNWGVEEVAQPFGASLYLAGDIPVNTPLPSQLLALSVLGEVYVDLDLDPDGDGPTTGYFDDEAVAVNGTLIQTIAMIPGQKIEVTLSEASMGARITNSGTELWASGGIGPSEIRFASVLPLSAPAPARAAIYLSSNFRDSYFMAETRLSFRGSEINLPLIPDMVDFDILGTIDINSEGITVRGEVSGRIHQWIRIQGTATVELYLGWGIGNFYASFLGNMVFKDDVEITELYFGGDDIRINGRSYLPF